MQHYDITFEYIQGPLNVVADGFSRLLKPHQHVVAHTIAYLRQPTEEQIHYFFNRKCNIAKQIPLIQTSNPVEHSLNALQQTVIPDEYRAIIARAHNSTQGHFGIEKTVSRIRKSLKEDWKGIREHVRHYIRQCPHCQKMSYLKGPIHSIPFTTAAYEPMERQNWDTIGPLTRSDGSSLYIVVAIDCFTRWVELWTVPDTSAENIKLPMLQHFGRYGCPQQVLTDNGTQFINKTVEEITSMVGYEHIKTVPYSKEENSIVERVNREVMRHLRALVFELNDDDNIDLLLPLVQRILNNNIGESNGTSPAQLMFGNAINLDRQLFLTKPVTKMDVSLSKWAANMLNTQDKLIKHAADLQKRTDETNKAKRTKFSKRHTTRFIRFT